MVAGIGGNCLLNILPTKMKGIKQQQINECFSIKYASLLVFMIYIRMCVM